MNRSSIIHRTTLQFLTLLGFFHFSYAFCEDAPLKFCWVSDLDRVFEDGYDFPSKSESIKLFGIRHETLSAQCVIQSEQDLKQVEIMVSPIDHTEGGYALPADHVQWNFVGSIFIQKNTPKLRKTDLIRPAPARFPDYLAEDKIISLKKGKYQAVYLTLQIPIEAPSGFYRGTVSVKTDKGGLSLPLSLRVYPLTLPVERHLQVTEWFSTGKFKTFHGIDDDDSESFRRMLSLYAENMTAHRQNVFRLDLGLIRSVRDDQNRFHFDFSEFDRRAEIFWETGGMDLLETGFVARFGEGGWSSHEIVLRDFPVVDETSGKVERIAGEDFLPRFLPALEKHLKEKGWLEKTLFHIADEPSNHNIMKWREASDFVHRCAPSLRRFDAIETPHCQDRLEVWAPKLDSLSTSYDAYRRAQRRGSELWFYTVGIYQKGSIPNKTVDVPLIESRVMHWLNYRYGLSGYLHWGFNYWSEDPFESPGIHNGDGWHVYPKKDGLLNSLRWEQMRNGIQDYEHLWMLEEKTREIIDSLSERLSILDPSRRGVEIASRVARTFSDYTKDPDVLYEVKKQVVEEILDLDVKPRLIVQTNPMEHTAVAADCAIDLFGYADPGAKITVNGRELPVADDGLFMENIRLSKEFTIVVEAEHQKKKKKVVRFFKDLYLENSR